MEGRTDMCAPWKSGMSCDSAVLLRMAAKLKPAMSMHSASCSCSESVSPESTGLLLSSLTQYLLVEHACAHTKLLWQEIMHADSQQQSTSMCGRSSQVCTLCCQRATRRRGTAVSASNAQSLHNRWLGGRRKSPSACTRTSCI